MRSGRYLDAIRLAALVALTAATALLVHYWDPEPGPCPFDTGCQQVLFSTYGRPLGVPLPLVGIVAFAVLFGLALAPGAWAGRLLRPLAVAIGLGGAALILLQVFMLGRVCAFCLAVDTSAVVIALVEIGGRRGRPAAAPAGTALLVWLGLGAAAVGLGISFGAVRTVGDGPGELRPPPSEVMALWLPDKVNLVEVADFQCPQCRRMHAVITALLGEQGDRIHFIALTAPLPSHPEARTAARAFVCARQQGKGAEMAEALFRTPDLTPAACERLAASLGLGLGPFRACVADPATDRRLDATVAWARTASPTGLPIVWVQDRMLYGVHSLEELRQAVQAAERRAAGQQAGRPGGPGRGNQAAGEKVGFRSGFLARAMRRT